MLRNLGADTETLCNKTFFYSFSLSRVFTGFSDALKMRICSLLSNFWRCFSRSEVVLVVISLYFLKILTLTAAVRLYNILSVLFIKDYQIYKFTSPNLILMIDLYSANIIFVQRYRLPYILISLNLENSSLIIIILKFLLALPH
jgi:hypothetical protein